MGVIREKETRFRSTGGSPLTTPKRVYEDAAARMNFDQREWVNDIVTGAITGVAAGSIGALFIPDPSWMTAMVAGGVAGLITGILVLPLKWLLNRRP